MADSDDGSPEVRGTSNEETMNCLEWARSLQALLNDDSGCDLFEKYLAEENCDTSDLFFVYACNGLRLETDSDVIDKKVRVIFKHYVKSGLLHSVSDVCKAELCELVRNKQAPMTAESLERARKEVEDCIMRTTYSHFIQSDLYLESVHVATANVYNRVHKDRMARENLNSSPECVNSSYRGEGLYEQPIDYGNLPSSPSLSKRKETAPPPLPPQSEDVQRKKKRGSKAMHYAETLSMHSVKLPPNPYHVKGSSFVPPSTYNSEIQSVSSSALSENETRKEIRARKAAEAERQAVLNKEKDSLATKVIPRTNFRVDKARLAELQPMKFFEILEHKLRAVIRERDFLENSSLEDQFSQMILDNHVDRVFASPPTRTPINEPLASLVQKTKDKFTSRKQKEQSKLATNNNNIIV